MPQLLGLAASIHDTPIGPLRISADPLGRLCGLVPNREHEKITTKNNNDQQRLIDLTRWQLDAYFRGHLIAFDLPLELQGTAFQQSVWRELMRIPFGRTISYKRLAANLGDENKARAAGQANGQNPIYLVIPCHRVIAADDSLGGWGGGLENKQRLLDLEAGVCRQFLS